jgi:hypothetical protein
MNLVRINKTDHRVYLELQGYNMKYLFLGIYIGPRGEQAVTTYKYTFMDMEGSNEGERPTEVLEWQW